MKLPYFFLITALIFAVPSYAKKMTDRPGERIVTAVNPEQSTVTISIHGAEKTFRTDMNAEFVVNGVKATIRELAPDMRVTSLSLSDPETISKIEASGRADGFGSTPNAPAAETRIVPPPAVAPVSEAQKDELMKKLAGTFWQSTKEIDNPKKWLCLREDGTAIGGWSQRPGVWKIVGLMTIQYTIPDTVEGVPPVARIVHVDPEFTKLTGLARIYQPSPHMVKRAASMGKGNSLPGNSAPSVSP